MPVERLFSDPNELRVTPTGIGAFRITLAPALKEAMKGTKGDKGDPGAAGKDGASSSSSSGAVNWGEQIVPFGTPSPELTEVVQAVAATWVAATSKIMCTVRRNDTEEDAAIQNLQCSVFNRVAEVGFDIHVSAPDGYSGDAVVMFSGA